MRWRLIVLAALATSVGCYRDNPEYDDTENERTTQPTAETQSAGSTSVPDETTAVDSTGVESTGELPCNPGLIDIQPTKDNFLITASEETCSGNPCLDVNFGAVDQEAIVDGGELYRAHLLMSFDIPALERLDTAAGATMILWIGPTAMATDLELRHVFPTHWNEGGGDGNQIADMSASSWRWSSQPDPWASVGVEAMDSFDVILDSGALLFTPQFPPLNEDQPLEIQLPPAVLDGPMVTPTTIHLDVTSTGFPTTVFAQESVHPPLLVVQGC